MDIKYLGHSSFHIKTKDASLVTDPFGAETGLKFPKVTSDIVTVSHHHEDHNKAGNVVGTIKVFDEPGEYEVAGISLVGIETYHDEEKGEKRGKNTIFVIEAEGFRLVHLGDLGHKLDEAVVDEIGEIHVAMIPVGGVYTIGPKDAVEVAKSLDPKIVVPMHYKTKDHDEKMFGELSSLNDFLEEMDGKVEEQNKLRLSSPESLPEEETLIVVLNA